MRETLARVVGSTEAKGGDAPEEHLHPAYNGKDFAENAVEEDDVPTDAAVDAPCEVQFEVDPE